MIKCKYTWRVILAFGLLALSDIGSTHYSLKYCCAYEMNPFAIFLWNAIGFIETSILKVWYTMMAIWTIGWISEWSTSVNTISDWTLGLLGVMSIYLPIRNLMFCI